MKTRIHYRGWPTLLAGAAAFGMAAILVIFPVSTLGQSRGSGGGSGRSDSSGSRRDDSSSRRDYSPPSRREDPAPRRDYSPPARREDSAPRRDYTPSHRDYSPPRRDYTPSYRDYTPSRRDDSSLYRDIPQRDSTLHRDSGSLRHDDTLSRRNDPISRRDDTTPHRDIYNDNSRTTDRTLHRDTTGDIFNRRGTIHDNNASTHYDGRSIPEHHTSLGRGTTIGRSVGDDPRPQHNRALDIFSRSQEGRRYQNGIVLRGAGYVPSSRLYTYFPAHFSYFPYYAPTYDYALVTFSPFSFYYGVCPPYIYRRHCYYYAPSVVYVEFPVYYGDECRGYPGDRDNYYLDHRDYDNHDPSLDPVIDDIRTAFRYGNIDTLVNLTDPNIRIAIYLRGKYDYSLAANDYLDMTRDAMRTMDTIEFDLYRIRHRAEGVYVVSGKHFYRDRDGNNRTVYVSFALERLNGRWIITQVATAPDRIQEP